MKFVRKLYVALLIVFLYAPIATLAFFSFNKSRSRAQFTGFTLDWYAGLFKTDKFITALTNTLMVAALSALAAAAVGTLAALGIHSMKKGARNVILKITNLPVLNPDIVTGVSLMALYAFFIKTINLKFGFITVLASHITFNIPYVILSVLPKLRQLDKNIYEAALDLGASPYYAYRKVILPEIWPGVVTGTMLAFTLSVDDFVITFFTTGSGFNTISTLAYSMTKQSVDPRINALSTIMFVAVLILLFLVNRRGTELEV